MAKIESWFDCDLKRPVQVQVLSGNVFSLDNNGSRIGVKFYDNGQKTTVTGSVSGRFILANGQTIDAITGTLATVNGQSVAYLDVPQSVLHVPGPLKITIQLTDSSVVTTVAAILATVYQTKTDDEIVPSQQVIDDWNAAITQAIGTQNLAIANQDAKIDDLKSAFEATNTTFNSVGLDLIGQEVITFSAKGYYIKTDSGPVNPTDIKIDNNKQTRCAVIDCNPGDSFIINGTGGQTPRLWCFIRADGGIMGVANADETRENYMITAPANSAKLIINNKGGECFRGKPFSQVENELSNDVFVPKEWEVGKTLNSSGALDTNAKGATTGFIPVLNRKNVAYAGAVNNGSLAFNCNVVFFNALKQPITTSGTTRYALATDKTPVSIPDNAVYLKFSLQFNSSASSNFTLDDTLFFGARTYNENYNRYTSDTIMAKLFSVDGNRMTVRNWTLGSVYGSNGAKNAGNPTYACTENKIAINTFNKIKFTFDDAYTGSVCFYKMDFSFISPRVSISSGEAINIPSDAVYFGLTFGRSSDSGISMTSDECNNCVITFYNGESMLESIINNRNHIDALESIYRDAVQINDGMSQTAACASSIAYDTENGIIFYAYSTGVQQAYGESTGKLMLSVFPATQPTNIRFVTLDTGNNTSRGILCNAIRIIGSMQCRVYYTLFGVGYYKDYDYATNTVSEPHALYFRNSDGDVQFDSEAYQTYIEDNGYSLETYTPPIINKLCEYNNEIYTAVTLDGVSYPVLCKIDGNNIIPFAIRGVLNCYEFRYYIDATGIHGVYRNSVDNQGMAKTGYAVSTDGGETWTDTTFADGIQSRPDIIPYYGKPLVIYNYKSSKSTENFPPMHNFRNSIKMLYDGAVIYDAFSKYGIVEHETISIRGDLYIGFSDSEKALMIENGAGREEGASGRYVEDGKEMIKWKRLGYLL